MHTADAEALPSRRRLALALLPASAFAQAWPAGKPIRIVVPYTPGGSSDIIARAISQPLSDALKQTVIVENKPGANGNTGTDFGRQVAGRRLHAAAVRRRRAGDHARRSTRSCRSIRPRTCAA